MAAPTNSTHSRHNLKNLGHAITLRTLELPRYGIDRTLGTETDECGAHRLNLLG
jgi:hypothetical protein